MRFNINQKFWWVDMRSERVCNSIDNTHDCISPVRFTTEREAYVELAQQLDKLADDAIAQAAHKAAKYRESARKVRASFV